MSNDPLVVGYRIMLSNNHTTLVNNKPRPFFDICDVMVGTYPKTFVWTGWHPQCRCIMVPITISEDELFARIEARNENRLDEWQPKNVVEKMPPQFNTWISDNKDRIKRAATRGTLPYWIRNNEKVVDKKLSINIAEIIPSKKEYLQELRSIAKKGKVSMQIDNNITIKVDLDEDAKHVSDDLGFFRAKGELRLFETAQLPILLNQSTLVKISKAGKGKDKKGFEEFLYFEDAQRKLYYNVAKKFFVNKNGKKRYRYILYSITTSIKNNSNATT